MHILLSNISLLHTCKSGAVCGLCPAVMLPFPCQHPAPYTFHIQDCASHTFSPHPIPGHLPINQDRSQHRAALPGRDQSLHPQLPEAGTQTMLGPGGRAAGHAELSWFPALLWTPSMLQEKKSSHFFQAPQTSWHSPSGNKGQVPWCPQGSADTVLRVLSACFPPYLITLNVHLKSGGTSCTELSVFVFFKRGQIWNIVSRSP